MSEQQIQKVKVKRLAHIGLWTTDVIAQARFYRQVLGFDLQSAAADADAQDFGLEEESLFLSLGDEHHSLGLYSDTRSDAGNSHTPSQGFRLHHIAFEVSTHADLAALAARLKQSDVELTLKERGDLDIDDALLTFSDPDGNRIEVAVAADDALRPAPASARGRSGQLRPRGLQHIALHTPRLEAMVEFYTDALGFDISDWLLRECVWLRCNNDHHGIILSKGKQDIDHVGYSIGAGAEVLAWADYLSQQQTPVLWGPGRHGAGNDLFLRFADADGLHIELSAELQKYYDHDATTPPRLWHSRPAALNLWGVMPAWMREEIHA